MPGKNRGPGCPGPAAPQGHRSSQAFRGPKTHQAIHPIPAAGAGGGCWPVPFFQHRRGRTCDHSAAMRSAFTPTGCVETLQYLQRVLTFGAPLALQTHPGDGLSTVLPRLPAAPARSHRRNPFKPGHRRLTACTRWFLSPGVHVQPTNRLQSLFPKTARPCGTGALALLA